MTKSRILPIAFSVIVLGCGGTATETNGDSAGASGVGGAGSAGDAHSGAGGLVNGIVYPDNAAGGGGTGGGLNGAGGDEAVGPNMVLACAPDNLSLLLPCTTPIVIGTACDPAAFLDCRQDAELVLCGPPGSCVPVSDAGGYYD